MKNDRVRGIAGAEHQQDKASVPRTLEELMAGGQGEGIKAVILVDGYAGRREIPCRIISETKRGRYRVEITARARLPSGEVKPGDLAIVPRSAVRKLPD